MERALHGNPKEFSNMSIVKTVMLEKRFTGLGMYSLLTWKLFKNSFSLALQKRSWEFPDRQSLQSKRVPSNTRTCVWKFRCCWLGKMSMKWVLFHLSSWSLIRSKYDSRGETRSPGSCSHLQKLRCGFLAKSHCLEFFWLVNYYTPHVFIYTYYHAIYVFASIPSGGVTIPAGSVIRMDPRRRKQSQLRFFFVEVVFGSRHQANWQTVWLD